MCVICMKYRRIIIITIIISRDQILLSYILQTHHARTHARSHARARARTHACAHARSHARTHTRIHAHARTHACTHTHAHTHTHTHTHTHNTHTPPSPFRLSLFDGSVAPSRDGVIAAFRRFCWRSMAGRWFIQINTGAGDPISRRFWVFLRIEKLLGRTDRM